MDFSSLLTKQSKRHTLVLILCLICGTIIVLYKTFLQSHANILNPRWINLSRISHGKIQRGLITPTFLHFYHIQILDFVIYRDPDRLDMFSVFLSGCRYSWTWSEIHCFFHDSNTSVSGVIDRRSVEPFVVCPLPYIERKLVLSGSSQLFMSLRINDKTLPNRSFVSPTIPIPVYWREQYNVSVYTMIRDKKYELVEWIEYHLMIGIEHFYLYDHFSSDNLEFFLRPYIERNIVTIVRWPYEPLKGHHWNMIQSASMNHALKNFGPFNKWMGYFDVDEYFQIKNLTKLSVGTIPLSSLLDQRFPESRYPGGVQFLNCPISCFLTQSDVISSRYSLLFEKCRNVEIQTDCKVRTKLFIRPHNVPIMQNIHALESGIIYANSLESVSFAEFRHYHYGTVTSDSSKSGKIDSSMDLFIKDLKERVIKYRR